MPVRRFHTPDELFGAVGTCLGESAGHVIGQGRIDAFATATEDRQWIHVDVERARSGPFGSTIAHGYLTLSLVPVMLDEVFVVEQAEMILNYGLNRVRFPAAASVGSEVRGSVELLAAVSRDTSVHAELRVTIQVAGATKPCCVAEPILRYVN